MGRFPGRESPTRVTSLSTATGTTHDGAGSMRISRRLLAGGSQIIRANDNAQGALTPAAGTTLSAWVLVPEHTPGTHWTAQLEMQDSSYRWVAGPNTVLTPGRWSRISVTPSHATWSATAGLPSSSHRTRPVPRRPRCTSTRSSSRVEPPRPFGGTAVGGSLAGVRGRDQGQPGHHPNLCAGGGVLRGAELARNHPAPWIDDPADAIVYEAHYYFDRDNSGLIGSRSRQRRPTRFAEDTARSRTGPRLSSVGSCTGAKRTLFRASWARSAGTTPRTRPGGMPWATPCTGSG